jgi:hypothetical protein
MVHLNRVATNKEVDAAKSLANGMDKFTLAGAEDEPDDHTATVYGSKYAAEDLPRHEMPVSLPDFHRLFMFTNCCRTARCRPRCRYLPLLPPQQLILTLTARTA